MIELTLPYPISSNRYWASRVIFPKMGDLAEALRNGALKALYEMLRKKTFVSVYVTPEAEAYREACKSAASHAIRGPLSGRLRVHIELYPHRPLDWKTRQRKLGEVWDDSVQCIDLGNCEKVMSDALQGIVFADDCMYRRIVLDRMEPDENGARLVVRIEQIEMVAPQASLELA